MPMLSQLLCKVEKGRQRLAHTCVNGTDQSSCCCGQDGLCTIRILTFLKLIHLLSVCALMVNSVKHGLQECLQWHLVCDTTALPSSKGHVGKERELSQKSSAHPLQSCMFMHI